MTKVTISLPDEVHQALEEESGRLGRSIESLIEERLTSSGPTPSARVAHLVEKARGRPATPSVQLHGVGPWQINYVNPADDPRARPK
jgi:hypothetical protein